MSRTLPLTISLFIALLLALNNPKKTKIIAHRGGVVDSTNAENSLQSLKDAYRRGYYMVEIDVRLSSDGQLLTNHDDHFKKYFNNPATVSSLPWDSIRILTNNKDGGHPLLLEEVLQYCKGKLQVMIDNKIKGNDTTSFRRIEELLRRYNLLKEAQFIGTPETRQYFMGKAACGYPRKELEQMMKDPSFEPGNVFLFDHGNVLTESDVKWAQQQKIAVVPSINKFHYTKEPFMSGAQRDIANLRRWGVEFYQVDSEFDIYLK